MDQNDTSKEELGTKTGRGGSGWGCFWGVLIGFAAPIVGLILMACAEVEDNKLWWKRFTKGSMIGVLVWFLIGFYIYTSTIAALLHTSSGKKLGDDCIYSSECSGDLVCGSARSWPSCMPR